MAHAGIPQSDFDYLGYISVRFWPFWIALEPNIHVGPLCIIHYLKVVFNATETESAWGIRSLKFIFSNTEQKIKSSHSLK